MSFLYLVVALWTRDYDGAQSCISDDDDSSFICTLTFARYSKRKRKHVLYALSWPLIRCLKCDKLKKFIQYEGEKNEAIIIIT